MEELKTLFDLFKSDTASFEKTCHLFKDNEQMQKAIEEFSRNISFDETAINTTDLVKNIETDIVKNPRVTDFLNSQKTFLPILNHHNVFSGTESIISIYLLLKLTKQLLSNTIDFTMLSKMDQNKDISPLLRPYHKEFISTLSMDEMIEGMSFYKKVNNTFDKILPEEEIMKMRRTRKGRADQPLEQFLCYQLKMVIQLIDKSYMSTLITLLTKFKEEFPDSSDTLPYLDHDNLKRYILKGAKVNVDSLFLFGAEIQK